MSCPCGNNSSNVDETKITGGSGGGGITSSIQGTLAKIFGCRTCTSFNGCAKCTSFWAVLFVGVLLILLFTKRG